MITRQINQLQLTVLDDYAYQVSNDQGKLLHSYRYHPEMGIGQMQWRDFIRDEDIKEIYRFQLYFTQENKIPAQKVCSNIAAYEGSFDGVNEWLFQEVVPVSLERGFKYLATIIPKDFFAQLALEMFQEQAEADQLFVSKYFDEEEAALAWLKEVE